jgi:hypothetical protein
LQEAIGSNFGGSKESTMYGGKEQLFERRDILSLVGKIITTFINPKVPSFQSHKLLRYMILHDHFLGRQVYRAVCTVAS